MSELHSKISPRIDELNAMIGNMWDDASFQNIPGSPLTQQDIIPVTKPFLPPLHEFVESLQDIWQTKQLTNNGKYHRELERKLADFLGVEYISLFSNGTLALLTALQVLRIQGEVITTPFSFVATTHALHWNGITPVFGDIEPSTFNLDADKIEKLITPSTTAIMPVHIYGNPCNLEKIRWLADVYGLKVIYDAAHAFDVKLNGESILKAGDLSVLSFHATKVFTTFEGGAIVCRDEATKNRIDYLKNFGFANEVTVVGPGINGKMNELQAAMGLLQLKYIDLAIARRQKIALHYRKILKDKKGISIMQDQDGVHHNYSYFPVLINEDAFGISRDKVYSRLRENNIFARRYFYPLISQFPTYKGLPSAHPGKLPVAESVSREVLCLPIFSDLHPESVERICKIVLSSR